MGNKPQLSRDAIDRIRAKIDAARLINRLQDYALSELTVEDGTITYRHPDGRIVQPMSKEQIGAAKVLLDKIVPNVQSIETNVQETRTFVLRAPPEAADAVEWLSKYGPKTIDHKAKEDPEED